MDSRGEQEVEAVTTTQQAALPVLAHVATVFVSCLEIPSTANLGSNTLACVTNNISLCSCGREMKSVQTNIVWTKKTFVQLDL